MRSKLQLPMSLSEIVKVTSTARAHAAPCKAPVTEAFSSSLKLTPTITMGACASWGIEALAVVGIEVESTLVVIVVNHIGLRFRYANDVDGVTMVAQAFAGVDGALRAVRRFRKGSMHTAKEVVSVSLNASTKWLLDVI